MFKTEIISKKIPIIILITVSLLFSSEITVKEIQEIFNSQGAKVTGFISNLQTAPFNNELMSFEVTDDNDHTVKIFLFNVNTKNIFQVQSSDYSGETKGKKKYYPKDRGVQWHPYKNWFVFYGNGLSNRDQLYICRVVVPELINNFAVNGYRIKLEENLKEEKSKCIDPAFDMSGDNIYFSRSVQKRDKKAKYNRSYNLSVISDVFKYRDFKFKDVEFKTVLDKRFDQLKPLCSPGDKNLIAYISFKNQEKKGEDYYPEYSINVYNAATTEIVTVDNMDGYKTYPYKWNNSGTHIFYFKALSLLRTPQKFIDDKINQVNLHFAKINKSGNKTEVLIQTNPKTDILLDDVVASENSITFINENNILLSKWDPFESIYLVDINLWKNNDKKSSVKLQFDQEFDTQYPILVESELYFTSVVYIKNSPVTSINSSTVTLKLSGGEKQFTSSVKVEMDSGASDDSVIEEEFSEDEEVYEDTEDSEVIVETKKPVKEKPVETKKPSNDLKIAEIEGKKSKLSVDLTKIDKQISDEVINIETLESTIKSLSKNSSDLGDQKNSYLESINKLKNEKTASLEGDQKQAGIKNQIAKMEIDKLAVQNEILKLENAVLLENNALTALEAKKSTADSEKKKLSATISGLRIEKTKTLETGNKMASFETQLKDLKQKNTVIDIEITKLAQQLTSNTNNLKTFEALKSNKTDEKTKLSASIDKIKQDRILSVQKDKQSLINAKEAGIAENKQKLINYEGQISGLTQSIEKENKNISDMRAKITSLNDEKLAILNSVNELKNKKASSAKELAEKKEKVIKTEEVKKAEPVAEEETYEEEDYGDDSSVDEDVFEEVETPTVNRRGRR